MVGEKAARLSTLPAPQAPSDRQPLGDLMPGAKRRATPPRSAAAESFVSPESEALCSRPNHSRPGPVPGRRTVQTASDRQTLCVWRSDARCTPDRPQNRGQTRFSRQDAKSAKGAEGRGQRPARPPATTRVMSLRAPARQSALRRSCVPARRCPCESRSRFAAGGWKKMSYHVDFSISLGRSSS